MVPNSVYNAFLNTLIVPLRSGSYSTMWKAFPTRSPRNEPWFGPLRRSTLTSFMDAVPFVLSAAIEVHVTEFVIKCDLWTVGSALI